MYKVAVILGLVGMTVAMPQFLSNGFAHQQPLAFAHQQPLAFAHQQPLSVAQPLAVAHHAQPLAVAHHAQPVAFAPAPVRVAPIAKAIVQQPEPFDPHPQYNYAYSISDALTGDSKSASESRDGDVVRGQYSLVEPDGSIRTVTYTADAVNGFNAVVDRQAGVAPVAVRAPVAVAPAPILRQVPVAAPQVFAAHPQQVFAQRQPAFVSQPFRQVAAGPAFAAASPALVRTQFNSPHAAFAF